MSRRNNYKSKRPSPKLPDTSVASGATTTALDDGNPLTMAFRSYARELDDRHDRYERIVKLGRDICIESKRIIFQLHSIRAIGPDESQRILATAGNRIDQLVHGHFAAIATELIGQDPYQYVRAYSAGLQEFIEAYTYWQYASGEPIADWQQLGQLLTIPAKPVRAPVAAKADGESLDGAAQKADKSSSAVDCEEKTDGQKPAESTAAKTDEDKDTAEPETGVVASTKCVTVDPMEYLLGLGDTSGEVMRQCINALGAGDFGTCYRGVAFLRNLFMGFNGLSVQRNRGLSSKLQTLRSSMLKVEHVCYNIQVRGKEVNALSLVMAANAAGGDGREANDDDEGFSNY